MDCICGNKDLETKRQDPCSCHIHPPCGSCVDAPYFCEECGEIYDIEKPELKPYTGPVYKIPKRKTLSDLSRDTIDWIYTDNGGRSFVEKHGYCPKGTTQNDILRHLNIIDRPCLPKFKAFQSGGYWKLSYFTD